MDGSGFGMGTRSLRYSMIVRDGVVETVNIESNPGQAVESGVDNLMSQLG
jgi:peroxiredoxin